MKYPLQPQTDVTDPDVLLDAFLAYVHSSGIELYSAQEEAILEVFASKNVILNTPTGSGKSLVAAAMHFYSSSLGRRSVYTCPIKALVNEKFLALCRDFGPDNVGMMTGDASVNRDAPILCCTAEILANIALRDGEQAAVDDVIMDEFHYYADPERGVSWQVPLLSLPQSRFLLISATLGETHFFQEKIENLTGATTTTVSCSTRPVPLEFEYLETSLTDTLDELCKQNRLPVYIVHFTQRSASETAQNLTSINVCSKAEKTKIAEALQDVTFASPFGKTIKKLLRHGIGLHHAGLLPKYRVLIEKLAQQGLLKLICGTDTLGVGINIPIRTVLYTQLCKYDGQKTGILSARDFHQISGRAGRKGFDDVGYVIALAPEHVIENKRLEAKAGNDPKKLRKLVKRKPPERGFVHWDESTYLRLQKAPPEPLQSTFSISHGMLLNVLSRDADGCTAMRALINDCHNTEASKKSLRKQAFQMFRAQVEREIIQIMPKGSLPKLRVNVDLQDDFSLNNTLALYCIDTIELLDLDDPEYALKVLSLVEAILENPDFILRQQLAKLKDEKVAEMKSQGMDYDARMDALEKLEHPKPEREFIYDTFNEFSRTHPWVGSENIRPKSIVREMYEAYSSFADYIKNYGLLRAEGLLLRHLSHTYRVLVNTVPEAFRNDQVDEVIIYLEHLLRHVDSSLLDEWEKMRDPNYESPTDNNTSTFDSPEAEDITRSQNSFTRMIRNEVFKFLRLLANKDYTTLAETQSFDTLLGSEQNTVNKKAIALEKMMDPFYEDHGWILLDPSARSHQNTHVSVAEDKESWHIRQTIIDPENLNDWFAEFTVDIKASRTAGTVIMIPAKLGPWID